jgi:DNA-binding response OmpR family regulator
MGKTQTLRQVGYEVLEAATGLEALRMAAEHAPRLVVLDVNLPDLDGWEVCRRIKADPATASIVVLHFSTKQVHERDTVRSLETGADILLGEPIEPPVLVATVRALLRARRANDALRDALTAGPRSASSATASGGTSRRSSRGAVSETPSWTSSAGAIRAPRRPRTCGP